MSSQAQQEEHSRSDVAFVAIGYNDACTNFLVRFHRGDFDNLKRAITAVDSYNEFRGKQVAAAFAKIEHLAYYASFGREGSPVLYVELDGFEKTPEQLAKDAAAVTAAFKAVRADEQAVYTRTVVSNSFNAKANGKSITICRAWWD